jgi:hypothetical protein
MTGIIAEGRAFYKSTTAQHPFPERTPLVYNVAAAGGHKSLQYGPGFTRNSDLIDLKRRHSR